LKQERDEAVAALENLKRKHAEVISQFQNQTIADCPMNRFTDDDVLTLILLSMLLGTLGPRFLYLVYLMCPKFLKLLNSWIRFALQMLCSCVPSSFLQQAILLIFSHWLQQLDINSFLLNAYHALQNLF